MKRILILGISLIIVSVTITAAQQKKAESKEAKIARALSAAPPNVAKAAKVVDRDENGNETVFVPRSLALCAPFRPFGAFAPREFLTLHPWKPLQFPASADPESIASEFQQTVREL